MNVVIRTDASTRIGSGHVMRCLALAEALRRRGASVSFVCRLHEGHLCDLLEGRGFHVNRLAAPPGDTWAEEAATVKAILVENEVDWLVVDHYALDANWEGALRPHVRSILVLDDLADRAHDCDALLDQNLLADATARYAGKVPSTCVLLMGPEYALLQPAYAELHQKARVREGPVRTICVSFGGTDPRNLTMRALEAFLSLGRADVALDVVTGFGSPHEEVIRRKARVHPNVRLHSALPTLASVLVEADLAIGAGGTTTWERLCVGVPALVVTTAENQRAVAAALDKAGLIRWLGHHDAVGAGDLAAALDQVLTEGLDKSWSSRCLATVDGRGAERTAAVLTASAAMRLTIRRASASDEALLLQWANDPGVRAHSFNQEPISPDEHRAWLRDRLEDHAGCSIYILETPDGVPLGQVRFDLRHGRWEIDYSIARAFRGRKLGRRVLEAALRLLRAEKGPVTAAARVKLHNRASRKVFEALGFELDAARSDGYAEYTQALEVYGKE